MMTKVFEIKAQIEALNKELNGFAGDIMKSEEYSLNDKIEVLRLAKPHETYIIHDDDGYIDRFNRSELENGRRYTDVDYDYVEYTVVEDGWIDEEYDKFLEENEIGDMNPEEQDEHYERFVESELDKIRAVFVANGIYSYTIDW